MLKFERIAAGKQIVHGTLTCTPSVQTQADGIAQTGLTVTEGLLLPTKIKSPVRAAAASANAAKETLTAMQARTDADCMAAPADNSRVGAAFYWTLRRQTAPLGRKLRVAALERKRCTNKLHLQNPTRETSALLRSRLACLIADAMQSAAGGLVLVCADLQMPQSK